jgi:UDP:flavonoid glycosyltransferase YjiC (YdhE family)
VHLAVVAPPTPGHLNPLTALAAALAAHGHRCTLVHEAGAERFVADGPIGFAAIDGAGALDEYLALLARPTGPLGLQRMIAATAAKTRMLLDGAPATIERIGADAVLADMAEAAGPLIARRLGLPFVTTVTGLPLMSEPDLPPPFVGWPYLPGPIGRVRNRGGYAVADMLMRPIRRVVAETAAGWDIPVEASDQAHVAQCPAALDFPRPALPPRFHYGAPWRTPEEGAVELPDDRPLVFCSLGTLQGGRKALLAAMSEACERVGARAVVAHGGGLSDAEAAALPGEPLVRAWWPQRAVLARCRAAILHGGFNTVLDALAAGTPMVLAPIAFEQPATAARVERVGAGRVVPFRLAAAASLAHALQAVLEQPSYREAAARMAFAMAGRNGAADAAATISAALSRAGAAIGATASPDSDDARGDSRRNESR